MRKVKDRVGDKYNRWTIERFVYSDKFGNSVWLCRCECGNTGEVGLNALTRGRSKGCFACGRKFAKCGGHNKLPAFGALYRIMLRNAKAYGRYCDITFEDFLEYTRTSWCHYCEGPVFWYQYRVGNSMHGYNLDRMDSSLGYSKDNVIVCCTRCNTAKSDHFSYEEFLKIGKLIRTFPERIAA